MLGINSVTHITIQEGYLSGIPVQNYSLVDFLVTTCCLLSEFSNPLKKLRDLPSMSALRKRLLLLQPGKDCIHLYTKWLHFVLHCLQKVLKMIFYS